jgi:hypothetical protein
MDSDNRVILLDIIQVFYSDLRRAARFKMESDPIIPGWEPLEDYLSELEKKRKSVK